MIMAKKKAPARKAAKKAAPSPYARQDAYAAEKRAAGEHRQYTMKLKTAEDIEAIETLERRYSDLSLPAITRLALRELAAKSNRR